MMNNTTASRSKVSGLTLAALGVVFGDIGTSPLYTMREVFSGHHPLATTADNVLGILSLILWSLILVVTVKYVTFILRADNRGEGGIMALIALAKSSAAADAKRRRFILLAGITGACMFFADGMITPAISVLSAVEGLEVAAPHLHEFVIPITLGVLFGLFAIQKYGTGMVGRFFGPVVLVWFITLGILGLISILQNPDVLHAVNPAYGWQFFLSNQWMGFVALGAVVLAVTGSEAIYADMGHFGRLPIRLAWLGIALPGLLLNYFGQGALILRTPESVSSSPFYLLSPEWMLFPLIALATMATVIASQAVISGTFSVTRQAVQLGFLPRTQVLHTSEHEAGQIYLPRVNWALMVAVMTLVIGFGSSSSLAAAYGIAVTGDMVITTLLAALVFRGVWRWSWARTIALTSVFLVIDLAFFSANVLKIPAGGWLPLLVGAFLFVIMLTWKSGRELLHKRISSDAIPLELFIDSIKMSAPTRVEGAAVFLNRDLTTVPSALLHNLKHNKVLHDQVVIVTVVVEDIPHVDEAYRVRTEVMPFGFYRVELRYGFKDEPDIPRDLALCARDGLMLETMTTTFFIGRESVIPKPNSDMAFWRERLFVAMHRNADSVSRYFKLPPNRVVELGGQILL
ncbi:MAG: potassium transporter [Pseudomonadota bacterium]|jgi:KUP system potassium uptake protein